jgi:hypothetical protein
MPTLFAFRLSTYLTLALAVLCVAYAEWDILRQASYFGVVVLTLLGVAFWCEGRYELDLSAANRVGFVIGVAAAAWIAMQFVNKESLIYTLPWPASLLPYLGPLLMVLMPAKLFRPKHVGDWWAMQGIGLAAAGLASAIAEDTVFVGLLALYAAAGVWSLSLFYYLRAGGLLPPVPHTDPGPAPSILASEVQVEGVRFGGRYLAQTAGWVAAALVFALPLFFLTPRSAEPSWQFGKSKLVTGLSGGDTVDLNKSGDLGVSHEVAYGVYATRGDGSPVADLSPDQRFQSQVFGKYEDGRWARVDDSNRFRALYRRGTFDPLINIRIRPDFGPRQVDLTFTQATYSPALALADPVTWVVDQPPPVSAVGDGRLWFQRPDGTFYPKGVSLDGEPTPPYCQRVVFREPPDEDLGSPFELSVPFHLAGAGALPDDPLVRLRVVRLPRLRAWSRDLFRRLALTDPAVAGCLTRATEEPEFQFAPEDYETVARRLTAYFQTTDDYHYTLKLRRLEAKVDPVEEFLFTTREGHCERYAAAVALILRCVGVPTQYVLGFKGCDAGPTPGQYVIRQEHAHAWVDVLVPRPAPADFPFVRPENALLYGKPTVWQWLSVDPTPGDNSPATRDGASVGNPLKRASAFLSDFVIGYDADRRDAAVRSFTGWVLYGNGRVGLAAVSLGCLSLAALLAMRARRSHRPTTRPSGYAWYDRYRTLVRRSGEKPGPGETAREVAARLDAMAGGTEATRVVERYYATRYAGLSLTDAENAETTALVAALESRLRGRHSAS